MNYCVFFSFESGGIWGFYQTLRFQSIDGWVWKLKFVFLKLSKTKPCLGNSCWLTSLSSTGLLGTDNTAKLSSEQQAWISLFGGSCGTASRQGCNCLIHKLLWLVCVGETPVGSSGPVYHIWTSAAEMCCAALHYCCIVSASSEVIWLADK